MPLARARCSRCTEPLGDPPYASLPVACTACGRANVVSIAADGQPADFDVAFRAMDLLRWMAGARTRMAQGMPGVAVGACASCRAPLVVSSRQMIELKCPRCGDAKTAPAADALVDQWPEPWARAETLECRVAIVDDASGQGGACPSCALPIDPRDPSMRCPRCGGATWVKRGDVRIQLAARIDDDANHERASAPRRSLVPLVQGEAILRVAAARDAANQSTRSVLGLTGIGCAVAIGLMVLFAFVIALAIHWSK